MPVVALLGEVDLNDADALRSCLQELAVAHPSVVIDLTDTVFLDSSVVHELVRAHRGGLEIAIRGRHSAARRSIELMGLDAVFRIDE